MAGEWAHYGAEFTLSDSLTAAQLLSTPEKYVDQNILVEGKIADVCQKAGCSEAKGGKPGWLYHDRLAEHGYMCTCGQRFDEKQIAWAQSGKKGKGKSKDQEKD